MPGAGLQHRCADPVAVGCAAAAPLGVANGPQPVAGPVRVRSFAVGSSRVAHPLADRVGEPVIELCRGPNGNALFEFADGFWTVAPWRAAR